MLRIRLARRGRRNLNSFAIVTAEQRFRRDGRFIEKLGYYQPLLKNDDPYRFNINKERYEYWVKIGAQPSEKIKLLAAKNGCIDMPVADYVLTKKSQPKKKSQERSKFAIV